MSTAAKLPGRHLHHKQKASLDADLRQCYACPASKAASIAAPQVLRQFFNGELPQDLADIQKYAAFKAADIRKALREGRTPTPGECLEKKTETNHGAIYVLPQACGRESCCGSAGGIHFETESSVHDVSWHLSAALRRTI